MEQNRTVVPLVCCHGFLIPQGKFSFVLNVNLTHSSRVSVTSQKLKDREAEDPQEKETIGVIEIKSTCSVHR